MTPDFRDVNKTPYETWGGEPKFIKHISSVCMGGIGLSDNTKGLVYKYWAAYYDLATGDVIIVDIDENTSTVLFNEPDIIEEITLVFDQNANPSICYMTENKVLRFYWFDSILGDFTITDFETDIIDVKASLDMQQNPSDSQSDIILTYIKGGAIFNRLQRERYAVVHTTPVVSGAYHLVRVGLSKGNRYQIGYQYN